MKKNLSVQRLNPAAFRVDSQSCRGRGMETLLDAVLAQVLGGESTESTSCTEFTCNMYVPPPPPS